MLSAHMRKPGKPCTSGDVIGSRWDYEVEVNIPKVVIVNTHGLVLCTSHIVDTWVA